MAWSGDRPSVVVVGAGVFGASIACSLVARGWAVEIIEAHAPGHARSSSHDHSRLLRMSHGDEDLPDNWYTRSALHSRKLWLEIGEEEGVELFVPCGALWLAHSGTGFESRSASDLAALQIPAERMDPVDAAQFFPGIRHDDLALLLYEPLAGVLRATTCVSTLIKRALRSGASLRTGRALPGARGPRVNGQQLAADRVVWACGPWLPAIFPRLVHLRPVKQSVFYFGVEPEWTTPPLPAWIVNSADTYGLGNLDGNGFKAAHAPPFGGPRIDPDLADRIPEPDALVRTREVLGHRFPVLAEVPVIAHKVCQYELTPDQHFIVAPTDDKQTEWIVGGGSGHGFKHGPALGEHVADLLEARAQPQIAFSLGRRTSGAGTTPDRAAPQSSHE